MKEKEPKYADEIYTDDGRRDDGKDHKGDWGSHARVDRIVKVKVVKSRKDAK